LVVRSSPEKPKLVGNRWRMLDTLEESTIIDIPGFDDCKELWHCIENLQLTKPEIFHGLNKGFTFQHLPRAVEIHRDSPTPETRSPLWLKQRVLINPWHGFSEDPAWISHRGQGV
jgi:hypothetical protein